MDESQDSAAFTATVAPSRADYVRQTASRVGSRPCAAACVAVVAARPHPGAACGAPGDQEDAA